MRLIDADALKEDLDTINPAYHPMTFWFKKNHRCTTYS